MDTVSDALTRIKNGYMSERVGVTIRYSKLVLNLCQLLAKEGFISECVLDKDTIKASLKYDGRTPALTDLKRVSKPGLRIYKRVKELPRVLNGYGIAIISTPKGLMTDKEARKAKIGGEVIVEVW